MKTNVDSLKSLVLFKTRITEKEKWMETNSQHCYETYHPRFTVRFRTPEEGPLEPELLAVGSG